MSNIDQNIRGGRLMMTSARLVAKDELHTAVK